MEQQERDELLIRLDERIGSILMRLEKGDICILDHEKRIGKLESFQNMILAFAAAISLGVSALGSWILSQFKVS